MSSSALESRRRAQGGGDPGSSLFASSERNAPAGAHRITPDKSSSSGASSVSESVEIAREMRELRERRGPRGENTVSSAAGGALERTLFLLYGNTTLELGYSCRRATIPRELDNTPRLEHRTPPAHIFPRSLQDMSRPHPSYSCSSNANT
jgi:hypothetical protein